MRSDGQGGVLAGGLDAERPAPGRWGRRLGLKGLVGLALVALLLLLAIAQFVLPRIAARVLRDRVARYGPVQSASVSALPAVQLLWGSADSASLDAGQLAISPHELVRLLIESRPVGDLTVHARGVRLLNPGFGAGPVELSDAVLRKRGEALEASARLSRAALQAALPQGIQVGAITASGGSLRVRASGQLFGFRTGFEASVEAVEGKLLLAPSQPLLAGLARITLFSDPRLRVLGVSATADAGAGGQQSAWTLHLSARLG